MGWGSPPHEGFEARVLRDGQETAVWNVERHFLIGEQVHEKMRPRGASGGFGCGEVVVARCVRSRGR